MENMTAQNSTLIPKYSNILILSFILLLLVVNWLDLKFVRTLDIITTTGTFFIGIAFCLLIMITEVYGFKTARVAIWWNIFLNTILIILGNQITTITGANIILYDNITISSTRLISASLIAAFFSQNLNAYLLSKMKIVTRGEQLISRIILPAVIASGLDSFLVNLIAFYRTMNNSNLISIMLSVWFFKILIIFGGAPILAKLCKKLKYYEKIDIYDTNTKFNPFSIESRYTNENNYFNQSFSSAEASD